MQTKKLISSIVIAFLCWLSYDSTAQHIDAPLTDLIHLGISKSHTVNIKVHDIKNTQIDQKIAKSKLLPKVTLNGSFTRLNDDITFDDDTQNLLLSTQKLLIKEAAGIPFNEGFPDYIDLAPVPNLQDKNILKSSLDVDWVLFSGFAVKNAVKASEHQEASLTYLAEVEKDKVALEVIDAYDKLALVCASQRVLNTSQVYLDEQEHFVRKAIENGLATPIDRKRIELSKQQLKSKFLEYEHNKTLLIEVLHNLTNENREYLAALEPLLKPYILDGDLVKQKRNEIKALEEAERATMYKSKMIGSNFVPKIGLKGRYEFIKSDLSLLDPEWYIGVGVKWNVFDGFESRLKKEKSTIDGIIYQEQRAHADEMVALSIINANLSYESAIEQTSVIEKELELANETYDLVNQKYKNNLVSINEVLKVLTELEKSNFKLQESYFQQRKAAIALLYAKGALTY